MTRISSRSVPLRNLRPLMRAAGLSYADLARALALREGTVRAYVSAGAPLWATRRIAQELGIPSTLALFTPTQEGTPGGAGIREPHAVRGGAPLLRGRDEAHCPSVAAVANLGQGEGGERSNGQRDTAAAGTDGDADGGASVGRRRAAALGGGRSGAGTDRGGVTPLPPHPAARARTQKRLTGEGQPLN